MASCWVLAGCHGMCGNVQGCVEILGGWEEACGREIALLKVESKKGLLPGGG